ncbi:MAG: hypothetical protein IPO90_14780 [Flavobacteriales bacterium]|nr:hypothetical protein [Flavobacteriales bacterium]
MDLFSPFNEAAVWLQNVQTDTSAWTTVSGWYTPDSAYTFLQIGNFFADSLLTPVTVFPNSEVATAYAFIDDVCVTYDSTPCDFSLAVATVTTETFGVFPNPSFGYSFITLPSHISGPWEGELLDASGRLVRFVGSTCRCFAHVASTRHLPTGVITCH